MSAITVQSLGDGLSDSNGRGARRTMVIELLREASEPLSVEAVAQQVGVHINTARFHLEALVDAGLATRESEVRPQPGRRRVLYSGTEAAQAAEPLHAYRLLSTILTAAIAAHYPDTSVQMYQVGVKWGRYLTSRPAPYEVIDESEIPIRLLDKLDSMWFVPEYWPGPNPQLRVRKCPFMDSARHAPHVVCQLHCGIINGSLEELGSSQRVAEMEISAEGYACTGRLAPAGASPVRGVVLREVEESSETEPEVTFAA